MLPIDLDIQDILLLTTTLFHNHGMNSGRWMGGAYLEVADGEKSLDITVSNWTSIKVHDNEWEVTLQS